MRPANTRLPNPLVRPLRGSGCQRSKVGTDTFRFRVPPSRPKIWGGSLFARRDSGLVRPETVAREDRFPMDENQYTQGSLFPAEPHPLPAGELSRQKRNLGAV